MSCCVLASTGLVPVPTCSDTRYDTWFLCGLNVGEGSMYRLVVAPKVICEILGLISQILMGLGQNVLFRRRKIWTRVVSKNNPLFTSFYSPAVI